MKPGDLELENQALEARLAALTNKAKKIIKPKKDFYLDPVKKNDVVKVRNNYNGIGSKIDYDTINSHNINKQKRFNQRKIENELSDCTFKPKLTKKTNKMLKNTNYVKPHEKKLKRKEVTKKPDEEETEEKTFDNIMKEFNDCEINNKDQVPAPPKKQTKIKKINPAFYERQLKWLNKKQQVAEKERLKNAMKEFSEVKPIPKTNKKKNNKMLGSRKKFIERIDDHTMKKKKKMEELDEKYNKTTFTPMINRNYNVASKVAPLLNRANEEQHDYYDDEQSFEEYPDDQNQNQQ